MQARVTVSLSRIASTYGCDAATVGVIFDKPASGSRTATAGWYNTAAFEEFAAKDGYYAKTINGDAFSAEIKKQTIDLIKQELGQIDCAVYGLCCTKTYNVRRNHLEILLF